jgi:hypothetical protein
MEMGRGSQRKLASDVRGPPRTSVPASFPINLIGERGDRNRPQTRLKASDPGFNQNMVSIR